MISSALRCRICRKSFPFRYQLVKHLSSSAHLQAEANTSNNLKRSRAKLQAAELQECQSDKEKKDHRSQQDEQRVVQECQQQWQQGLKSFIAQTRLKLRK